MTPATPTSQRAPLGLPSGSVRAILTLLIVAVVVVEVVRGRQVELLWTETLMIVMAHYFTSRRFIRLPKEILQQMEEAGHVEPEANPLYLPRHSVRGLIVVTFAALAVYLYQAGRLTHPESLSILVTVFAYLLGVLGSGLLRWWQGDRPPTRWHWWDDTKAVAVLLILGTVAALVLLDRQELLSRPLRLAALGVVLFYFGSR